MDEALYERTINLLDAFGWSGVAMVEYKVDERSGEPVLMEINGRFWGWPSFFTRSRCLSMAFVVGLRADSHSVIGALRFQ